MFVCGCWKVKIAGSKISVTIISAVVCVCVVVACFEKQTKVWLYGFECLEFGLQFALRMHAPQSLARERSRSEKNISLFKILPKT